MSKKIEDFGHKIFNYYCEIAHKKARLAEEKALFALSECGKSVKPKENRQEYYKCLNNNGLTYFEIGLLEGISKQMVHKLTYSSR